MAKKFSRPNKNMKFKLNIVILGFITLSIIILLVRVIYIAYFAEFNGVKYGTKALNQQLSPLTVNANRGTIYDRNMVPLAQSITVWTVSISPNELKDEEKQLVSSKLSNILDVEYEKILKKCDSKTKYEIIKKKVEKEQRDEILKFKEENKISGIYMVEDSKRFYPMGKMAAHLIGFTGSDNQGLLGIESFYDKELKGIDGKTVTVQNGKGGPMPYEYENYYPPQDGNSIVLSLDSNVQKVCDNVLDEVIKIRRPLNRALAIAIDVNNGEILAMSVKPDFDLNDPYTIPSEEEFPEIAGKSEHDAQQACWRNKAVSELYEPGSVFKILTGSAAIEEGLVTDKTRFTCGKAIKVGDRLIHCWKTDGSHGTQDFREAITNSCNPAFIKMGLSLGPDKFFKYFKLFGMTEKTGIDLPAEALPIYKSRKELTSVSLASESMGQTASITPIQMLMTFCAVVNGGYLLVPHVVKHIIDCNGNILKTNSKKVKRQVISEETCKKMLPCLKSVVDGIDGNGTLASVSGYQIGGKSGTGQQLNKLAMTGKQYYVASYIVVFPSVDNPKYAVMALVDSPQGPEYYGGIVIGPIVSKIVGNVAPYMGFAPSYSKEEIEEFLSVLPSCEDLSVKAAKEKLHTAGFDSIEVIGDGDTVLKQIPQVGSKINKSAKIVLYTDNDIKKTVTVPDIIGLTQAQANKQLADCGLNISLENVTKKTTKLKVADQVPKAGDKMQKGSIVSASFTNSDSTANGTY